MNTKVIIGAALGVVLIAGGFYYFKTITTVPGAPLQEIDVRGQETRTPEQQGAYIISGRIQSSEQEIGTDPDKIFNVWFEVAEADRSKIIFDNLQAEEKFSERPFLVVNGLEQSEYMQSVYRMCATEIESKTYCAKANTTSPEMVIEIANVRDIWSQTNGATPLEAEPYSADLVRIIRSR